MSVIRKLDRDPIVAFHVAYAKLPGSDPVCALFLSQVSYWCSRAEDGVAWITHQAMYDQTGMSRKQQDRAAVYWESVGVMKKFIKGIPPKIHYFIDYERLEQFLMEEPDGQVDVSERDILVAPNGQHVMSERGKTSNKDSRDSQRVSGDLHEGTTEQQPEKAAEPQTEALTPQSAAPTQASDAEQTPEQRTPSHRSARPPSPKAEASAQAIVVYEAYPLKVGRGAALPKIEIAIRTHGFEKILEATKAYAEATATWRESDRKYIPNPATWFNQQRYLDDRREWFKKSARPMNIPRTGSFGNED